MQNVIQSCFTYQPSDFIYTTFLMSTKPLPITTCPITFSIHDETADRIFIDPHNDVSQQIERYELRAANAVQSYTLSEEMPQPPELLVPQMTVHELLNDAGVSKAYAAPLERSMRVLGLFSCADLFVAGTRYMQRESGRRMIASGRIECLGNLVLRATGHELSVGRAAPSEYLNLYEDLGQASPIVIRTMGCYADFNLKNALGPMKLADIAAVTYQDAVKLTGGRPYARRLEIAAEIAAEKIREFRLRKKALGSVQRQTMIAAIQEATR